MLSYASLVLNWVLFLALFPIAFFWLRRAWRIVARRDFSEVALKRGQPPSDAARWAPFEMAINGIAGIVIVIVILLVVVSGVPYEVWTAIAGSTIWCKFLASFALGRHAHALGGKSKA
jgi:small-conductance mechanosensitive channel